MGISSAMNTLLRENRQRGEPVLDDTVRTRLRVDRSSGETDSLPLCATCSTKRAASVSRDDKPPLSCVRCRAGKMPDCEFFLNKRDYPQIKYHEYSESERQATNFEGSKSRGEAVEPYGFVVDADDRNPDADVALPRHYRTANLAPVASFYCSDRFADLPWPPSEDWEAAIGTIIPPSFEHEIKDNNIVLDSEPRDLFTDAKFKEFDCLWESKKETAFFRGTATGGGVTVEDNQCVYA